MRCAKRMVAMREMVSPVILRISAPVGEDDESPTPRPSRTARLASSDVMDEAKACRESYVW
jgi:hypothetical protein